MEDVVSRSAILKMLREYEQELLLKAEKKHQQQKWLLEGYYKAVAVHIRHLQRIIKRM